jgi:hypothetical protein
MLYCTVLLTACGVSKSSYSPSHKYAPEQLQKDYDLYRNILEYHHPGLYWYTSKDTLDFYFEYGRQQLKDSMTEPQFRKILNFVTSYFCTILQSLVQIQ